MGKTRFSEHVGSVTQPGHSNTNKPVGVHFRSAGHSHNDMRMLPIEKVRSSDPFVLEARERYWIQKYQSVCHNKASATRGDHNTRLDSVLIKTIDITSYKSGHII